MSLIRARLHRFALPLRTPLETAHGRLALRRGFLVEIEDEDGVRGFGEATPLPDFGTEDDARCAEALRSGLRALLATSGPNEADRRGGRERIGWPGPSGTIPLAVSSTPCADYALETARLDRIARRADCRLTDLVAMQAGHPRPGAIVPSQVVVSGRTPQAVAEAAQRARRAGAMTYKLKVALGRGGDPSLDVERVAALREAAGGAARLRLDANEGWREEQAQRAFERLADFGIDYVEQPVARSALDAMARLSDAGVVAVAADEALQGSGWQACLDRRAASVWILKPAALGGLRISVALAERARAEGLRTVWSTLLDGAVGRAAAAALAGALGAPGEVHGLGTASWLARDLCDDDGSEQAHQVRLRSGAGLGFTPRSEGSDLFEDHSIFETEAFTGGG